MMHPATVATQPPTMLPYTMFHPALGYRHMEYPVHPVLLPFHQQLAVNTQSGAFQYTVAGLPFQGHPQMFQEQTIRTSKNCFSPGQAGSSFTIDAILSKHSEKHEDVSSPETSPESRKILNSHRRHHRLKELPHPYASNPQVLRCDESEDKLQAFASFSPKDKHDKKTACAEWKSGRTKRIRTIFTPEQLERLETEFERQQYMVGTERYYLATELNLTEAQVKVWFQNRRIKWRKQTLEKQHAKLATSDLYHPAESDSGADSDGEPDSTPHHMLDTSYQNNSSERNKNFTDRIDSHKSYSE